MTFGNVLTEYLGMSYYFCLLYNENISWAFQETEKGATAVLIHTYTYIYILYKPCSFQFLQVRSNKPLVLAESIELICCKLANRKLANRKLANRYRHAPFFIRIYIYIYIRNVISHPTKVTEVKVTWSAYNDRTKFRFGDTQKWWQRRRRWRR